MAPGLQKNEKEEKMKAGNAFKYNAVAYLPIINEKRSVLNTAPGAIFTTVNFLCNSRKDTISLSLCYTISQEESITL
jgi:hypothetical protein